MRRGLWAGRRRLAVLALVVGAGVAAWWAWPRAPRLPERIVIEDTVVDFSAAFDRASVLEESPDAPVRDGGLQPSPYLDFIGGYRRALVAAPPARLRFRAHVPPYASLRFGAGVEGDAKRDPDAAGVRFTAAVDGRRLLDRVVNPAATRHDRRWFDERVPLDAWADRDVEIELATARAGSGARLAGNAGWSQVRLVREHLRDRQPARAGAPNVLVLLVDALRADGLGCYGANPSPSPTLDGLAARGLVFEQAIAQASWTMPSVASILTGLLPQSHGVLGETPGSEPPVDDDQGGRAFLADALDTLAERAADAGITTFGASANPVVSRGANLAQGFETFVEVPAVTGGTSWPHAGAVNRAFLDWLRHNAGRRFLGYLHYMDVHDPYEPPDALRPARPPGIRALVAEGKVAKVAAAINWHHAPVLPDVEVAYLRALYEASIRAWDGELATLLAGLRTAGVLDNTVVVVTADHGEAFQEHGKLKHCINLYDELLRVPLVVAGPGVRVDRVAGQVQGIDLLPTVVALLGLPPPPGLPGQNLLGAWQPRPAISETRWGILPDGQGAELVSLRTAEWKLIRAPRASRILLYDLAHDPRERADVFDRAPEGSALAALLARMCAEAPPPPRGGTGRDPRLEQKLRALGYVE